MHLSEITLNQFQVQLALLDRSDEPRMQENPDCVPDIQLLPTSQLLPQVVNGLAGACLLDLLAEIGELAIIN